MGEPWRALDGTPDIGPPSRRQWPDPLRTQAAAIDAGDVDAHAERYQLRHQVTTLRKRSLSLRSW